MLPKMDAQRTGNIELNSEALSENQNALEIKMMGE